MTPEQGSRRACTDAAVEATRPASLDPNERWDPFFPDIGPGRTPSNMWDEGKSICRQCPHDVRKACLELGASEPYGLWGGKSPRERGAQSLRGGPRAASSVADRAASWVGAMVGEWTIADLAAVAGLSQTDSWTNVRNRLMRLAEEGTLAHRVDETGTSVFRRAA